MNQIVLDGADGFIGDIPQSWYELSGLSMLDLSSNFLQGEVTGYGLAHVLMSHRQRRFSLGFPISLLWVRFMNLHCGFSSYSDLSNNMFYGNLDLLDLSNANRSLFVLNLVSIQNVIMTDCIVYSPTTICQVTSPLILYAHCK